MNVTRVLSSSFPDSNGQRLSADPLDAVFAGSVNIENEECVGVVEGIGEIVHERFGPRIAMRLEDHMNPAKAALFGGCQGRLDLGRMMAVIVDHTDARN